MAVAGGRGWNEKYFLALMFYILRASCSNRGGAYLRRRREGDQKRGATHPPSTFRPRYDIYIQTLHKRALDVEKHCIKIECLNYTAVGIEACLASVSNS